jgi:hypothetical protein
MLAATMAGGKVPEAWTIGSPAEREDVPADRLSLQPEDEATGIQARM